MVLIAFNKIKIKENWDKTRHQLFWMKGTSQEGISVCDTYANKRSRGDHVFGCAPLLSTVKLTWLFSIAILVI